MTNRAVRRGVATGALLCGTLLLVVGINSTRWIGRTFPGFLVMANRVVASVSLPDWLDVDSSSVFQHQILAVDGVAVESAAEVYERVAAAPPGTAIRYTLSAPDERATTLVTRSRRFSGADYLLLFGAFFLNGLAFVATALFVYRLKPRSPASEGLLVAGVTAGVFVITAGDLYGPHWFFRLHVIAESMLGAGFLHLALVFPTDRLRGRRRALLALYLPFVLLAVCYEASLGSPAAYTFVHLVATATHGLAAAAIIGAVGYDFLTSRSALVRRRTGVVALGTVAGFLVPGVIMLASAALGGTVPINAAALTAFLFPVSLGYAVVKRDLFEIDVMLRRGITYVIVVVTIASMYFVAIFCLGVMIPDRAVARSPILMALLNLGLLFAVVPIRARVQDAVDRVFFRTAYDVEHTLADLSHALASAHTLDEVVAQLQTVLFRTLCPVSADVFLHDAATGRFRHALGDERGQWDFTLPPDLMERASQGDILARYEWEDGSGRAVPAVWIALGAELLVPVRNDTVLVAMIALAGKHSGRAYTVHDITFLDTAASQVGLAMKKAEAFEDVKRAYQQLKQNQATLIRADRLATLGRLTAGIAHEINTPLAAVMNSLKVLTDLGHEYADSIGDAEVKPEDHRQIAQEITTTAEDATRWARNAAAFISQVKMHGREAGPAKKARFAVQAVVDEIRALLAHRLRAAGCTIDFVEDPPRVTLLGDPGRLAQVLLNLVGNAIDAYEERGLVGGRIEVSARDREGAVTVTVSDRAGGIPQQLVPRIFEELFTTKEPGRGTGLGLWIARNLVEESFGGTLSVDSESGVGSRFTATIPAEQASAHAAIEPAA